MFESLFQRFDHSFIIILILENFNFGCNLMVYLSSQDLFKEYMKQDPDNMSQYNMLINLPWSLQIFYGLISDNISIIGLKRKPYLIFFAFIQAVTMLSLYLYNNESAIVVTMLLFLWTLAQAFAGVVINVLLII